MTRRLLAVLTLTPMLIGLLCLPVLNVEAENAPIVVETIELSFSLPGAADDNDKLLQEYINRVLSGRQNSSRKRATKKTVGSQLTGSSLLMYNSLKPQIENVANGTSENTIFTINASELGLKTYTASELGVSSLVNDSSITNEAFEALLNAANYDHNKVLNALLSDCPYDLYWFDKTYYDEATHEAAYSEEYGFIYEQDDSGDIIKLGISQITVYMRVSIDYQVDADNPYLVDTQIPLRVENAANEISRIISHYANYDDLDKLMEYKSEICKLASYDSNAASNDRHYGDPWQLINVFDGNENTNVVCEGYSKAFKYLCDRSSFKGEIQCILATGTMAGGTGQGPHMWNIVKMPNNRNYMVDVTNSDTGSVGSDGSLFLKGYTRYIESNHQYNFGSVRYVYDNETLSTFEFNTWLILSNEEYTEIPISIILSDPATDTEIAGGTVICGYNYELPETCPFSPPTWTEFNGWYVQDDESGKIYQASETVRIMEDIRFNVIWLKSYPTMDSPDFILPEQIRTIGSEAFQGTDPHVVKIPNLNSGSQTIQSSAFSGCSNLRQVYIPASVDSIGENAFAGCAESLIIFGFEGSAAQIYADNNDILFVPVTE